ncbi:uncharacterized protein LOC131053448 [Cryptomeria japonica]|uniref:uncharacterized protein LOC131053448 n=1 Tax=Cryptomeria japonica TaxID=3369 RepID=UPI0027D9FA94|nr:uncharacterized protein LOC131053448 [Cryptomeria japonica]
MGDFNTPLHDSENFGGSQVDMDCRMDLMDFIDLHALHDVDLQGESFTWTNRRSGDDLIQVCLDRTFINNNSLVKNLCSLTTLPRVRSDHFPISFVVDAIAGKRNFPFRFENMWLSHPSLEYYIRQWWNISMDGSVMFKVAKKLRFVKDNVKRCNREVFGDLFASKTAIQCDLKEIHDKIQAKGYPSVSLEMENEILRKYHDIIAREEVFWKKISRAIWLYVGDINTRFFYMNSLKHKASNMISRIVVEGGVLNKDDEICGEATRFFASLLSGEVNLDVDA